MNNRLLLVAALTALICGPALARDAYESTYSPRHSEDVLLRGATVLTGTGERLENTDVRLAGGRIDAIGVNLPSEGARVVPANGLWVTPGIIDVHSHLGAYPSPSVPSTRDGNEMTSPNTARELAGGVTTLQILPGSANLFGGRGVTLKNVPARTVQEMKFPGAPASLKMACGENPKRVYGGKGQAPATRMGNIAGFRAAWAKARHTLDERNKAAAKAEEEGEAAKTPAPDLGLDTLIGVLEGDILIHNHCYRADEMAWMIDVGKEFGFQITAFHHAVEAYKIADLLAEEGICSALWADWWGFKLESFDGIAENVALVDKAGACSIVHSDSAIGIQRFGQSH